MGTEATEATEAVETVEAGEQTRLVGSAALSSALLEEFASVVVKNTLAQLSDEFPNLPSTQEDTTTVNSVSINAGEPLENSSDGGGDRIYSGTPNAQDFKTISRLSKKKDSSPEDWVVYCYRASDNFLNLDEVRWHPELMQQMEDKYVGAAFMVDHRWYSSDSVVGMVVESKLYNDPNPTSEVIDAGPSGEMNRKILREEGSYQWLMLKVAVAAGGPFDLAAQEGRTHNCSTGFLVYRQRAICPNCSKSMGREVTFTERKQVTDKGHTRKVNVCPHLPPNDYLRRIMARYSDNYEEIEWADYTLISGFLRPVELSACVSPNLPAATMV